MGPIFTPWLVRQLAARAGRFGVQRVRRIERGSRVKALGIHIVFDLTIVIGVHRLVVGDIIHCPLGIVFTGRRQCARHHHDGRINRLDATIGFLQQLNIAPSVFRHHAATIFEGQVLLVPHLDRVDFAFVAPGDLFHKAPVIGVVAGQPIIPGPARGPLRRLNHAQQELFVLLGHTFNDLVKLLKAKCTVRQGRILPWHLLPHPIKARDPGQRDDAIRIRIVELSHRAVFQGRGKVRIRALGWRFRRPSAGGRRCAGSFTGGSSHSGRSSRGICGCGRSRRSSRRGCNSGS